MEPGDEITLSRELVVTAVAAGAAAGQVDLTVAALPSGVPANTSVHRLRTANLAAAGAGLPGMEWSEAILFPASLGLDMREAAIR